jgi:hypothetical protein
VVLTTHPLLAPRLRMSRIRVYLYSPSRPLVACYRVNFIYIYIYIGVGVRGGAVVEALRYKPESRGIDSRWFYWNFSFTSFRPDYGSGLYSACNKNEYQEYFLGVKAASA